jgi:ribosomal protein L14E/L6E/L27E
VVRLQVLLDGPSTGVVRSVHNLKNLQLTKFKVPVRVGMRPKSIQAAFDQAGVAGKWKESNWAKNIEKKRLVGQWG